jgi:N-acetylglucosaminyldiphosphoundecaprenol N-acetyl-beta-D-mannosaminyltransferase
LEKVVQWGLGRASGFVCFANVHMTIEAYHNELFRLDLQKASLVLPDGKPIAIACKWLYKKKQERIAGMDFMPALLKEAHRLNAKIFLYGSTTEVLKKLIEKINMEYPGASVAGSISPPFRKITKEETEDYIKRINRSEAHFI